MLIAAILLFIAALAFVAAELFIPSHGILGIFALLLALAGVGLAYRAYPALGVISAILLVVIAPIVFYFAIKLYPTSAVGKRVILHEPGSSAMTTLTAESQKLGQYHGKRGVAVTVLRPAGVVEIEGERLDSMSEAEVIDAGTPVEVIRVVGTKVIVKAV